MNHYALQSCNEYLDLVLENEAGERIETLGTFYDPSVAHELLDNDKRLNILLDAAEKLIFVIQNVYLEMRGTSPLTTWTVDQFAREDLKYLAFRDAVEAARAIKNARHSAMTGVGDGGRGDLARPGA